MTAITYFLVQAQCIVPLVGREVDIAFRSQTRSLKCGDAVNQQAPYGWGWVRGFTTEPAIASQTHIATAVAYATERRAANPYSPLIYAEQTLLRFFY